MKVRSKVRGIVWFSNRFNIHGMSEIIVGHPEYGGDSVYIKDFDVFLENSQEWKDMSQAFRDHDLIVDNYNTLFFEPKTEEDRIRGYTLN